MTLEAHLEEGERTLAHIWKAMAVCGAVAVAFSITILIWPSISLSVLLGLFGAFAIVSGVSTIAGAFGIPLPSNRRVGLVLEGLLGIAVGVVVFVWPNLSALGLLYVIAAWAIAVGVFEIWLAFELPITGSRALLLGLGGLVSIAFGVIMFAEPGAGAIALLALIAAFLLVSGVLQIAYAFELRRVVGELDQRLRAPFGPRPVTHG